MKEAIDYGQSYQATSHKAIKPPVTFNQSKNPNSFPSDGECEQMPSKNFRSNSDHSLNIMHWPDSWLDRPICVHITFQMNSRILNDFSLQNVMQQLIVGWCCRYFAFKTNACCESLYYLWTVRRIHSDIT